MCLALLEISEVCTKYAPPLTAGYDAYCVRKMPAEAGFVPCFPGRFAWNPATQMAVSGLLIH